MRLDPWKLAALVLFVACVDEVARPDVAHAPGVDRVTLPIESADPHPAESATEDPTIPSQRQRERD